MFDLDILTKAADHLADRLNVADEYQEFKEQTKNAKPKFKDPVGDEWLYRDIY